LEEQLHEKKVEAIFTDALRRHLARNGFDPLMGARPMQRLIQDTIRKALADELLFGRLANGGKVIVDVDENDEVKLTYTESSPPDNEGEPRVEAEQARPRSFPARGAALAAPFSFPGRVRDRRFAVRRVAGKIVPCRLPA